MNYTDELIKEYDFKESVVIGTNKDFRATESMYEVKGLMLQINRPLKILYDDSIKMYFMVFGDLDYVHNNVLKAAIDDGFYKGYSQKNRNDCFVKQLHAGVISYMRWVPAKLRAEGYEDTEADMYDVEINTPFGSLFTKSKDDWTGDVYLPIDKNPLITEAKRWAAEKK